MRGRRAQPRGFEPIDLQHAIRACYHWATVIFRSSVQQIVSKLKGDRIQDTTMSRKWVVLCKDAHAVDFLSYYTFSPLAFFHLYFFTVDFLPFWLLVFWLFILFDFFTIDFFPSLLFYRWLFAVSTFSLLTFILFDFFTIDFFPSLLFYRWLFAVSTFSLLTFISFDFFTVDFFPFRPFTRRLLGLLTFDFWLSAPLLNVRLPFIIRLFVRNPPTLPSPLPLHRRRRRWPRLSG